MNQPFQQQLFHHNLLLLCATLIQTYSARSYRRHFIGDAPGQLFYSSFSQVNEMARTATIRRAKFRRSSRAYFLERTCPLTFNI